MERLQIFQNKKRHFHTLRHSAGVHRIEAGMDVLTCERLART